MRGVDVLIADCSYTEQEYPAKKGWGHGTFNSSIQYARDAGSSMLFCTHHEPTRSDDALDEAFKQAMIANPHQPGDPQMPSGQPGTENDKGTTDNPFGKDRDAAGQQANSQQLAGRLGEGETLQQFLPSAGDTSRAGRRYKELYQAMAPAAEDAVLQENIPLGSRFFIKRYFESIRPKE